MVFFLAKNIKPKADSIMSFVNPIEKHIIHVHVLTSTIYKVDYTNRTNMYACHHGYADDLDGPSSCFAQT